jgi:radical SAM protein with 4Fe4S-binding SPASM domain
MPAKLATPRCHLPWQQMVIDATGEVAPCCYWGAYENANPPIGNVNESSIEEIWNNERFQQLRRGMATDDLVLAGCDKCFALQQGLALGLEYDRACEDEAPAATGYARNIAVLKREIAAGSEILSAKPTIVSYTPSHRCNIRCTHCYQESTRTAEIGRERASAEILALAPYLTRIIAGGGEPFLLPIWREFLSTFELLKNPYLDFGASTNATIVTEKILAGLSRFKHLTINVSLDGTGEIYERVRVGARFAEVRDNIRRLKSAVAGKSARSTIGCTMSVMKSNIVDLPNFVRFCIAEDLRFGASPVTTMPPDESLCCFNDPAREMRGWAEAIAETRILAPALIPTLDVLEGRLPFSLAEVEHRRVAVMLPREAIESAEVAYPDQPLVAYIFRKDGDAGANAPYWAPIRDGSIEVSLPPGDYCVNMSSKWANSQYWTGVQFTVGIHDTGMVAAVDHIPRGAGASPTVAAREFVGVVEQVTAVFVKKRGLGDVVLAVWILIPAPIRQLVPTSLRRFARRWLA